MPLCTLGEDDLDKIVVLLSNMFFRCVNTNETSSLFTKYFRKSFTVVRAFRVETLSRRSNVGIGDCKV